MCLFQFGQVGVGVGVGDFGVLPQHPSIYPSYLRGIKEVAASFLSAHLHSFRSGGGFDTLIHANLIRSVWPR